MDGRYTIGGHAGPSEQLPRDVGGVEMRASDALPFNPPASQVPRASHASADDPAVRRRLPFIMFGLMLVIGFIGIAWVDVAFGLLMCLGMAVVGGLVFWMRSMD